MRPLALCLLLAICASCNKGPTEKSAFLDERKTVQPEQEWNREVVCHNAAPIRFRVTSEGPFSVVVLTQVARDAAMRNDTATLRKEGMLLSEDSQGPVFERTLDLTPGSYFVLIRNNHARTAVIRLECFDDGE